MTSSYIDLSLPANLQDLSRLSVDLRWTSSQLTAPIWRRLDPEAWEQTANPYLILLNTSQERLDEVSRDEGFLAELAHVRKKLDYYHSQPTWFGEHQPRSALSCVAYFSMEYGLGEALPIYSGGLGMLAGDHLKSASDLGVPLVGIGLLYQQGYFRQVLSTDGEQLEAYPFNDPSSMPVTPLIRGGRWHGIELELPGRTLLLRVWQAQVGRVPLYLLDSNDPTNTPWDRGITAHLYDAGHDKRLLQEIVLGIGGWRLVQELGLGVNVCHLNEGHAAFAVLARAQSLAESTGLPIKTAFRATRAGNVFTTHTPVAAAFDEYDPAMVARFAEPFLSRLSIPVERVLALGRRDPESTSDPFNMAFLALRGSRYANGVSQLHGEVSRKLFAPLYRQWPVAEVPVGAITNGVHIPTWNCMHARRLWVHSTGDNGWFTDFGSKSAPPSSFDSQGIWEMRSKARTFLIEYVRRRYLRQLRNAGVSSEQLQGFEHVLDPDTLTIGFARRFTEYKRPTLLLRDPDRLRRLCLDPHRPVQFIIAGKAHPNDAHGKQMVREMAEFARDPALHGHFIFLEDYDMSLARRLTSGVDLWLNNPRRPAEACGTSGMKILFNGGLNLSVRDGWWDEAWVPDVGWEIGDGSEEAAETRDHQEALQTLDCLEHEIIPEFYNRDADGVPQSWTRRIARSMTQLSGRFSSRRMVKDYVNEAYLVAAESVQRRLADDCALAKDLADWVEKLEQHWDLIHFGEREVEATEDGWHVSVALFLDGLSPDLVQVQLFADSLCGEEPEVIPMRCEHALSGAFNGFRFTATVPNTRPAEHFTPRVIPFREHAFVPAEESHILWWN